MADIRNTVKRFLGEEEIAKIEPFGEGHINRTYFVETAGGKKYIMQMINNSVFKDVEGLMNNICRVTGFIEEKHPGETKTLNFIPADDGKYYVIDEDGHYFRMYVFIDNAHTYQVADSTDLLEKLGDAFGDFQNMLLDFDASKLVEVIPDFHNTVKRYEAFEKALEENLSGRADTAAEEIAFVKARKNICGTYVDRIASGELPLRVTHNDTKMNNVLFYDGSNEAACVIDLDTIMPGVVHYDVGDAIRFGTATAPEDEQDLSKLHFDINLYEAFIKGFLGQCGKTLSKAELDLIPFSGIMLTFECGMRFLTDYLNGDTYFRTAYAEHNLVRTRTQFKLVYEMEQQFTEMKKILEKYI